MVRQTWTPDNLVGATRATSTLDFFQDRPVQVTEEDLAQRLRYTKAELISITLQKFSNLCTTKSRSSLLRLAFGILLSSLACGGSQLSLPAGDLIEPEDFIEAYVDLRAAALMTEDGQVTEASRSEVLDHHGISEEDLISFAQAYGEDLTFMQEVWNEVELRLENTR